MVLRILLRRNGARKLSEERTLYACVDGRFWRIVLKKSATQTIGVLQGIRRA
jgi:hypothetical protein